MNHISSYPSIYAIGHRAIKDIFSGPVIVEEKIDGCVVPETPILMADLTYIPVGKLSIGDKLIGFDDTVNDPRLKESIVTHTGIIIKECSLVITTHRTVIASNDHPWLIAGRTGNNEKRWKTTEELSVKQNNQKTPYKILSLPVWEKKQTWDAGYVAGFFDAEGSLVHGNGVHNSRTLSVYQNTGKTMHIIKDILAKDNFKFSSDIRKRGENWHETESVVIRGGWMEILRMLGTYYPVRLVDKAKDLWANGAMNYLLREEVISVTPIGKKEVVALSTSTNTYVANGMLCHNSQFSFGDLDGELCCRSKGKDMILDAPEKMFGKAIETVIALQPELQRDWVSRGEFLQKPKHNSLTYSRVPEQNIIIFDIMTAPETYLAPVAKKAECLRLKLECVPCLYDGRVETFEVFKDFLDRDSILGGTKIEGVVVKNYEVFTQEKKPAMGKYVSEEFKEVHDKDWKDRNPTGKDIVMRLVDKYRSESRWNKAIIHLHEDGKITFSLKDIGLLVHEIPADVLKECEDDIKETLFEHFWPQIQRGIVRGVPEYYKNVLASSVFKDREPK